MHCQPREHDCGLVNQTSRPIQHLPLSSPDPCASKKSTFLKPSAFDMDAFTYPPGLFCGVSIYRSVYTESDEIE
jgi:hypothetical protein